MHVHMRVNAPGKDTKPGAINGLSLAGKIRIFTLAHYTASRNQQVGADKFTLQVNQAV